MQVGCWLWPHPWCSKATGWAHAMCLYALLRAVLWLGSPWPQQTAMRAKEGQWWSCQSPSGVSAPGQGIIYPLEFMGMTGSFKRKTLFYHHVQTLWAQIKHSTQQGWQGPTQHINKPARFAFRVLLQRSFAHAFHHTGKCTPLPDTQFKGRKEKGLKALLSFMLIRRVIRFFRHWNWALAFPLVIGVRPNSEEHLRCSSSAQDQSQAAPADSGPSIRHTYKYTDSLVLSSWSSAPSQPGRKIANWGVRFIWKY